MSCSQNDQNRRQVQYLKITSDQEGQRIDNFLITRLKGLPKSRLYRLLRKGEVRVNKKRVSPDYKLKMADLVRIPPVFLNEQGKTQPPSEQTAQLLTSRILYEDENLLIINKPSGMSVHAGSTVRMGVIEAMKHLLPKLKNLELAHRLDTETSGCLILAKKKKILREIHGLLRAGEVSKHYLALTKGKWSKKDYRVEAPLLKTFAEGGKHRVHVSAQGKTSITEFKPLKVFKSATLVQAKILTGRTHQIRVHAASVHHPIAGDDRYGDSLFNKELKEKGLKRMFLHAHKLDFILPSLNQHITVVAPLEKELQRCLETFEKEV